MLGLARGLIEKGHEALVLCPPQSELSAACRRHDVPAFETPMRSELDAGAALKIAGALRRFGADVVHFHTARAHTLGLAAALGARTAVKVLSRRVDFPVGRNVFSRMKYRAPVDAVIAITDAVKDMLVAGGVSPESVTVIHSGIDLDKFSEPADGSYVREELGIAKEVPLVGAIGALAPHKAQCFLLKAAKNLAQQKPEVRYIIAGEGELEGELKSLARSLGVEDIVTFTGFRRDIREILSELDVFVLTSVAEGMCTSILDAMASGVPVVATAVGGVPEVVEQDRSGLLVPASDPRAIAGAVGRVLEDAVLRRRIVEGGKRRVEDFSIRKTVEKTERLYIELIGRKRGGLN